MIFKVLLVAPFFLAQADILAQKIKNAYLTRSTPDGQIYHIKELKGYRSSDGLSQMHYDLTFLDNRDSLTFNCTFVSSSTTLYDSITIANNQGRLTAKLSKLFIENNGNQWIHRYTAQISRSQWEHIIQAPEVWSYNVWNGGSMTPFSKPQYKHLKDIALIQKIMTLISLNKKAEH